MVENLDHQNAKFQIKEELENQGWEAYTEQRLQLLTGREKVTDSFGYIIVDVFAVKDGLTYVCELGRATSERRIKEMERFFDVVEHFPLGRKKFRSSIFHRNDWGDLCCITTCLKDRKTFGGKERNPLFEPDLD